jgi:hypothetical protein
MLYEMSNLQPDDTGLNQVIWVSVANANHGPRIKVFNGHKAVGPSFAVTIEDTPRIIGNHSFIKTKDINKIKAFVKLNKENLIAYWNYEVSTKAFYNNILKVSDDE